MTFEVSISLIGVSYILLYVLFFIDFSSKDGSYIFKKANFRQNSLFLVLMFKVLLAKFNNILNLNLLLFSFWNPNCILFLFLFTISLSMFLRVYFLYNAAFVAAIIFINPWYFFLFYIFANAKQKNANFYFSNLELSPSTDFELFSTTERELLCLWFIFEIN